MSQESFKQVVAESPALKEAWELTVTTIQAEASALGVDLDRAQIAELNAARLATVSKDVELLNGWQAEAEKLFPAMAEAVRRKDVQKRLADGEDVFGTSEPAPSSNAAARRLSEARKAGAAAPAKEETPARMGADEEALAIKRLLTLPPQLRIAEARRLGIRV